MARTKDNEKHCPTCGKIPTHIIILPAKDKVEYEDDEGAANVVETGTLLLTVAKARKFIETFADHGYIMIYLTDPENIGELDN